MTTSRDPHGWFSGAWSGWFACVLYAIARPDEPLIGAVVLVAFLPIEALAVILDTGARDTLSEIMTWLQRRLSRHRVALRGWNALIVTIIVLIAWLLGRTVWYYSGAWPLAVVVGGLTVIWLADHFISPHIHG